MQQWLGAMAAVAAIFAGPAQAAGGTSGAFAADPHAVFPLATQTTLDTIERGCARRGESVRLRQDDAVVCEVVMGLPERMAARVLLREPFASAPRALLRFTATSDGKGGTRVDVTGSVDDRRSAPHMRVRSLSGLRFARQGQALLKGLGGTTQSF